MKKSRYIALTIFLMTYIVLSCVQYYYVNLVFDNEFELKENTETLILGDSHATLGLNPEFIKESENLSLNSENFFYSYYKLKYFSKTIKNFNQVKNIILTVSPSQINKKRDETVYGFDEKSSVEMFERYFVLLDGEGVQKISSFNSTFIYHYLKTDLFVPIGLFDEMGNNAITSNLYKLRFVKGFKSSDKHNLNDSVIDFAIKRHFIDESGSFVEEFSDMQIDYLKKIIDFTKENKIRLILINMPLQSKYRNEIPDIYLNECKDLYETISTDKNVEYFDLMNIMDGKDNNFKDGDHLNNMGAKEMSKFVDSIVNTNR